MTDYFKLLCAVIVLVFGTIAAAQVVVSDNRRAELVALPPTPTPAPTPLPRVVPYEKPLEEWVIVASELDTKRPAEWRRIESCDKDPRVAPDGNLYLVVLGPRICIMPGDPTWRTINPASPTHELGHVPPCSNPDPKHPCEARRLTKAESSGITGMGTVR